MSTRPGWPTDPEMIAFIAKTAEHYPKDVNQAAPNEARKAYDTLCEAFAFEHPPGVLSIDDTISAVNPKREIPVRRYSDLDLYDDFELETPDAKLQELFGAGNANASTCLMFLHGGGWIVGGLDSHDSICAEICAASELDVVSVDYRLCPEHAHPASLDDAEAVFKALSREYEQVIVGGDSAGGHLAAALCIRLRDSNHSTRPVAQLLIYPALGADPKGGSYEENAEAPGLSTSDVNYYWSLLAGDTDWRTETSAEFAPLRAQSLADLPPTIITSAGCDPLRDDAMQYAVRLTQAGVPVEWRNDPQLIHGHLRARYMSGTAMSHFSWVCTALGAIAAQVDILNVGRELDVHHVKQIDD